MLSVLLTVFAPTSILAIPHGKGDAVCFDLEAWDSDYAGDDDEVHEDTECRVCAWQYDSSGSNFNCRDGIKNSYHTKTDSSGCIYFDEGSLSWELDTYIYTECGDGMWVDRFIMFGKGTKLNGNDEESDDWLSSWGENNQHGWCVSNERNDFLDWNHDSSEQYVPAKDCYATLRLNPDGTVDGWSPNETLKCRETKKMNCKQGCPSGWKHISTSNHGCCASFGNCGGNMKTCQTDEPCRRRQAMTKEDIREMAFNPELQGEGRWVKLSADASESEDSEESELEAPSDDASESDVAQRLSAALGL